MVVARLEVTPPAARRNVGELGLREMDGEGAYSNTPHMAVTPPNLIQNFRRQSFLALMAMGYYCAGIPPTSVIVRPFGREGLDIAKVDSEASLADRYLVNLDPIGNISIGDDRERHRYFTGGFRGLAAHSDVFFIYAVPNREAEVSLEGGRDVDFY